MTPAESIVKANRTLLVPPITPEESARRRQALAELFDEWINDEESDQDQRETVEVLRRALGPERIASDRPVFP